MNLSKDLSDQFNEKMQQTHDPKELDGALRPPFRPTRTKDRAELRELTCASTVSPALPFDPFSAQLSSSTLLCPCLLTVDFNIAVLGQGFWPVQPNPTEYTIPADLAKHYDRFVRYYNAKHSCVSSPSSGSPLCPGPQTIFSLEADRSSPAPTLAPSALPAAAS